MEITPKGFKKYFDGDDYDITDFCNKNLDVAEELSFIDKVVDDFPEPTALLSGKRYKRRSDGVVKECKYDEDSESWIWANIGSGGGGGGGSTIYISTSDNTLKSKTITLYRGETIVKTGTISSSGTCTMSNIMDTGMFKIVVQDNLARKYFEISTYSAYYITLENNGEYGFRVKKSEPSPSNRVEYLDDTDNYLFTPAKMNFTTGLFEYGGWEDFINEFSKPCMVKYDGTIDYYLDRDDYTLKEDGTGSDVANINYQGNAMCALKCYYIKRTEETIDGEVYEYTRFSSIPRDGYKAYAHINQNGDIVPVIFYRIYEGYNNSGKIRSLSGFRPTRSIDGGASTERTYCKANGNIWDMTTWSIYSLLRDMCVLVSKNCNSQEAFGNGNQWRSSSSSTADTEFCMTGTLDNKGMCWGSNSTNTHTAVKIFGMENIYADEWERCLGLINDRGTVKVKMCYGQTDNSTVDDYNLDGSGYVNTGIILGTFSEQYIKDGQNGEQGFVPKTNGASASTYLCDGYWSNAGQIDVAFVGGSCIAGLFCGVGCVTLYNLASHVSWDYGVSLSCFPPLPEE